VRLCVVGTGYVGLVSGTCFAEWGHDVTCVDNDETKILLLQKGNTPIYEPGLEDLVKRNSGAGRLAFSSSLSEGMDSAEAVFIAVGTPSRRGDKQADLAFIFEAAEEIAELIQDYTVVITKSTVPVGTGSKLEAFFAKRLSKGSFDVVSNPEFLREGSAIENSMQPDRIVVGTTSEKAREVLRAIYRPLLLNGISMVLTTRESSELIKYASNAFLATKISFINEIADLCEAVGADVRDVALGMGMDKRIGPKFLLAGPGYGGSCLPKDAAALLRTAEENDVELQIIRSTVKVNDERKIAMTQRVVNACGGSVKDKRIAILGLTFKPNTDDIRESPALEIIPQLQKVGARIAAYDPAGMGPAAKELADVDFCSDAYRAVGGADATVVVTEWNEFRELDLERVVEAMRGNVIVDLRNVYDSVADGLSNCSYFGIGKSD